MTLDEIFEEWEKDADINETKIDRELISIAKLHHKYHREMTNESFRLTKYESDYKILKKIKTEYYNGTLDINTIKERGYRPANLRILKTDIPMYLEADEELIQQNLKISIAKEKIKVLESIIKMIMNRGFHLKSYVDYIKFKEGVS